MCSFRDADMRPKGFYLVKGSAFYLVIGFPGLFAVILLKYTSREGTLYYS